MERSLKILSALFATAAALLGGCIIFGIFLIIPQLPKLKTDHHTAALIGMGIGYGTMLLIVYALSAKLIWRKEQWKKAMFLAAASCLGFPVGLVLGLAALILLTRPEVRKTFVS